MTAIAATRRCAVVAATTTALALVGLGPLAGVSSAATGFTWTGAGPDGNWSTAANWAGGVAPSTSDAGLVLSFPAGPTNVATTDDIAGLDVAQLTFTGTGYTVSGDAISPGAIDTGGSVTATVSNDLPLTADLTVTTAPGDVLHLDGAISGAHGFLSFGSGTVVFGGSSANTFTGDLNADDTTVVELDKPAGTAVTAGKLVAGNAHWDSGIIRWLASDQIDDATREIDVAASGTLDLNGFSDSVGTLVLNSGTVTTGAGTLTVDGGVVDNNTSGEVDGTLALTASPHTIGEAFGDNQLTINAHLTGSGTVDKTGSGTLTLNDACAYTGALTVSGGTVSAPNGYGGSVMRSGGSFVGGQCAPYAVQSPPTVTGTYDVGQVLTAAPGTYAGSPGSFAYQWLRCPTTDASSCAAIDGATGSGYTLTPADQGDDIAVQVTPSGDQGTGAPAQSDPAGPVLAGAAAPVSHTGGTYGVSGSSATLLGAVDGNGLDTTYWFEYGSTTAYGATTPTGTDAGGENEYVGALDADGLAAATVYHYRLVAENADGLGYGRDQTFRTRGPLITLESPSGDNGHSITLNASVLDDDEAATYQFAVTGPDSSTGTSDTRTSSQSALPASSSTQPVSAQFLALEPASDYTYTVTVTDADGTATTNGSFTTGAYTGVPNDDRSYGAAETGFTGSVQGDTTGATAEAGEPAHGGQPAAHSLWFTWTAPASATSHIWMKFTAAGAAGIDTVMSVYAHNSSTLLGDNDDALSQDSAVEIDAGPGVSYDIAVDTKGAAGGFTLSWSQLTQPTCATRGCPPIGGSFPGLALNSPYVTTAFNDWVTGLRADPNGTNSVGPFRYFFGTNTTAMTLGSHRCVREVGLTVTAVDCRYDWWNGFQVTRTNNVVMGLGAKAYLTFTYSSAALDGLETVRPDHVAPMRNMSNASATSVSFYSVLSVATPSSPGVTQHWPSRTDTRAMGGSYRAISTAGAWAKVPFVGKEVTVYTLTGPGFGKANLYLDNHLLRTVDLSSGTVHYGVPLTVTAATSGSHYVTVRVLGQAGAHGIGTSVAIDGVKVDLGAVATSPALVESWAPTTKDAGATMSLPVQTTKLTVVVTACPSCGRFSIGGTVFDSYAATTGRRAFTLSMTSALRTVTLTVLGSHSSASTGSLVTVQTLTAT